MNKDEFPYTMVLVNYIKNSGMTRWQLWVTMICGWALIVGEAFVPHPYDYLLCAIALIAFGRIAIAIRNQNKNDL